MAVTEKPHPSVAIFARHKAVFKDERILLPDDLRYVVKAVHSLSRYNHGIGLCLHVHHLEEIEARFRRDPLKCLIAVLNNWLKQAVGSDGDPEPPTWRRLVYVVADPLGGNNQAVAANIAQNYEAMWLFQPSRLAMTASAQPLVDDHMSSADIQHCISEVVSLLVNVQSRWYEIGVLLGVPLDQLDMLLQNPDLNSCLDQLRKTVELWLRSREGQRSWQVLVDTVQHHAGGNHPSLAKSIADGHPASGTVCWAQGSGGPRVKAPTIQEFQSLKWTNNGKQECIRIMRTVTPRWRDFGIALGFSVEDLDTIEQGCLRQPRDCIQQLFAEWARSMDNYSWSGLVQALVDSEHENLASDVSKALSQRSLKL